MQDKSDDNGKNNEDHVWHMVIECDGKFASFTGQRRKIHWYLEDDEIKRYIVVNSEKISVRPGL